jgi:S1-C subfamily serine protease
LKIDGKPTIEKVVRGSRAEKAGLSAGDVILELNGEDVTKMRLFTLVRLMGAESRAMSIAVLRRGDTHVLTVPPAELPTSLGRRPAPRAVSR